MRSLAWLLACLASPLLASPALATPLEGNPPAPAESSAGEPAAAGGEVIRGEVNEFAAAAAEVDRLLWEEVLHAAPKETIAPRTGDAVFLRRVYLDLVGVPPTPTEIARFLDDNSPEKRTAIVEKLLADRRYAANWSRYWRDVIMYRRSDERALLAAGPLEEFLTASLRENRPWSEVATHLITASGDVQEDGRTALIMAQMGQPEETVAEISRIFLGIQIQCAQCHDHPYDSWSREQFHELAAFFPRVAVRPQVGDNRTFLVTVNDRPTFRRAGGANRFIGTPEHSMPNLERPEARGTTMTPRFFLTGESLRLGTSDAQRRVKLAAWITAPTNPWFAKAYVNRMWAELVGEGFFEPVDDIGPERTPTAPRTLEYLAAGFTASGYDPQWLFRVILATEAYQRESRSRRAHGETPFTANVPQRLRADQLYDSLSQALGGSLGGTFLSRRGGGRFGGAPRALFAGVFGYDPSDPRSEVSGAIPQALNLMNSPIVNQAVSGSRGPLATLLRQSQDDVSLVKQLFLRTLSREPSPEELQLCLEHLQGGRDRAAAAEDLLWSLINSSAFLHRG